jgi:hypothetical protein
MLHHCTLATCNTSLKGRAYTKMLLLRYRQPVFPEIRTAGDSHGDVDQLDKVANEAHDRESDSDGSA